MVVVGQEVMIIGGVREGRFATILELLDCDYYYALADTHIPDRRVKIVMHRAEFELLYTVLGFYNESGQIFSDHVVASDPSVAIYQVAEVRDDACFICAISGWCNEGEGIDFAGESIVDAATVLEQPDVFNGLNKGELG